MREASSLAPPRASRSSAGITSDGTLDVRRVSFFGSWRAPGRAAAHGAQRGRPSRRTGGALHRRLRPDHSARPGRDGRRAVPVPRGGAEHSTSSPPSVEVAAGGASGGDPGGRRRARRAGCRRRRSSAEAVAGRAASRFACSSGRTGREWSPRSAAARRSSATAFPCFAPGEEFTSLAAGSAGAAHRRRPAADGRIMLVAVDGRQPGLKRRADELRAGAGARPARRRHRDGVRQRRLDHHGLRRYGAEQPVRRARAADRDGARVRVHAACSCPRCPRASRRTATASTTRPALAYRLVARRRS